MKYLVTGGLGVIGSLYALDLVDPKNEVVVVDDGKAPRHDWTAKRLKGAGVRVVRQPLEARPLAKLFDGEKPDRVLHAAASTGIPYSSGEPTDDWNRNAQATIWLLEELRRAPVPTVVLSSVKPYKVPPRDKVGVSEATPLFADEPYAASKAAQSCACQAWGTSLNVPVIVLRCSNLYGPAPCHGPRHGWLTWFAIQAALGQTIEVQGTGLQSRDMLWHTDLQDAVRRGHEALEQDKVPRGSTYNIGGGPGFSVTLHKAISELQRYTEVKTKPGPARKNDDDWFATDYTKARHELAWNPTVDPRDGIRQLYEWAWENRKELARLYE